MRISRERRFPVSRLVGRTVSRDATPRESSFTLYPFPVKRRSEKPGLPARREFATSTETRGIVRHSERSPPPCKIHRSAGRDGRGKKRRNFPGVFFGRAVKRFEASFAVVRNAKSLARNSVRCARREETEAQISDAGNRA